MLTEKRASQWGALFSLCHIKLLISLLLFGLSATVLANEQCHASKIDIKSAVRFVIDGDTVVLRDGRHVRLIGVNAPEIGRKGKVTEQHAEQAKHLLQSMLAKEKQIYLQLGKENKDRYGRLLAHGFLPNGQNLSEELLSQGVASHIVIPPNRGLLECYQNAETRARRAHKGIWSKSSFHPIKSQLMTREQTGYHFVQGRVSQLREKKGRVELLLEGGVLIQINRKDLWLFKRQPSALIGEDVLVRGWFWSGKEMMVVRVRHPSALEPIEQIEE